jgi:hypothetical protein
MLKTPRRSNKSRPPQPGEQAGARWLLLIHQIPPKPDYLRVKIGRRLQRVGAVPIKNSVYALPAGPESYEDFQWIMREIAEGGGDAFVSESLLGDGLTDEAVRARFDAARNEEYREILADAKALLKAVRLPAAKPGRGTAKAKSQTRRPALEHELAKLRRRYESASAIDFFGASEQAAAAAGLAEIRDHLRPHSAEIGGERQASRPLNGATWVTRRDVHVDRIASAWLIRRFIDRRPTFRFVDPNRYAHRDGELRFDMFEAEYTHVGDACTFETLVSQFVPDDAALREIAEIVHDVDCKDAKFRREEAPGLARMIVGIAALSHEDEDRVEQGTTLFDNLYAAFGGKRSK